MTWFLFLHSKIMTFLVVCWNQFMPQQGSYIQTFRQGGGILDTSILRVSKKHVYNFLPFGPDKNKAKAQVGSESSHLYFRSASFRQYIRLIMFDACRLDTAFMPRSLCFPVVFLFVCASQDAGAHPLSHPKPCSKSLKNIRFETFTSPLAVCSP